MRLKSSKKLWVLLTVIVTGVFLALSIQTRHHFDYTTGRVRTSQRIAWITYDSHSEDTWLTEYAPKNTMPVWLSMHTVTPILSSPYTSDGARLRNDMNTFKQFLYEMDAGVQAIDYLAATFFNSVNNTPPGIDPVQSTLDSFQCLYMIFPFPPNDQPITLEILQTIFDDCFSTNSPQ